MTPHPPPTPERRDDAAHANPAKASSSASGRPPRSFVIVGLMSVAGLIGVPMVGAALVGTVTAMEHPSAVPATPESEVQSVPISVDEDASTLEEATSATTTSGAASDSDDGTLAGAGSDPAGGDEVAADTTDPQTSDADPADSNDATSGSDSAEAAATAAPQADRAATKDRTQRSDPSASMQATRRSEAPNAQSTRRST